MKVCILDPKNLTPSLDLRATTYADPTRDVDRLIKVAEATISKAQKRLQRLQEERERLLSGAPPQLHFDASGNLRAQDWKESS